MPCKIRDSIFGIFKLLKRLKKEQITQYSSLSSLNAYYTKNVLTYEYLLKIFG